MPHDQPDPARIVEELAGDMPDDHLLADLADEALAAVGRLALQRTHNAHQHSQHDKAVIGRIAAEYHLRNKSWREIAAVLAMNSHMTVYRWAQPFLGSNPS